MAAALSNTDILNIEAISKDVLSTVFGDVQSVSLPVDLERITKNYGLSVQVGKFPNPDISGAFNRKANRILVADDEPYERKVFTIAHELGHYILHQNKDEEIFFRSQLTDLSLNHRKQEAEANWFAASLLMPEKMVREYWEKSNGNIETMAKLFGVSHAAAFFRLKNLKLIDT